MAPATSSYSPWLPALAQGRVEGFPPAAEGPLPQGVWGTCDSDQSVECHFPVIKAFAFFSLVVLVFYFLPFISLKYFICLFLGGRNYLFF